MFRNFIRVQEANCQITITLFTEFKDECIAVNELMVYEEGEQELAEKYVQWYRDNGAEVEWIICEGMSPYDDSQYH